MGPLASGFLMTISLLPLAARSSARRRGAPTTAAVPADVLDLSHDERSDRTATLLRRAFLTEDQCERARLREQVVVLNLRVAHAVAARYRGRGVPLEDLEQAASVGLIKAVANFDPDLRHDFLSYAVPTMRGEVQRYFRDLSWVVRPPRRIQDLQWRVNRAIDDLSVGSSARADPGGDVRGRGVDRAEYDEAVAAAGCFQPTSLDQPVAALGSDVTVGESVPHDADTDGAVEARTVLSSVVRTLSDRDRRILYLRFFEDQTQREIGEELGVPQMQVSRWLNRIYRDLRDEIDELDAC